MSERSVFSYTLCLYFSHWEKADKKTIQWHGTIAQRRADLGQCVQSEQKSTKWATWLHHEIWTWSWIIIVLLAILISYSISKQEWCCLKDTQERTENKTLQCPWQSLADMILFGQWTTEVLSRARNQFSFEWKFEHREPVKQWEARSQERHDTVNQCKTSRKAALSDSVGTLQWSPRDQIANEHKDGWVRELQIFPWRESPALWSSWVMHSAQKHLGNAYTELPRATHLGLHVQLPRARFNNQIRTQNRGHKQPRLQYHWWCSQA